MTPWDLLKAIFFKQRVDAPGADIGTSITLNKWLAFDQKTAPIIRDLVHYTFYVSPQHYYYLLYLAIPKHHTLPKLYRPTKEVVKPEPLLEKVRYVLGWTDSELHKSRAILEQVILSNESYWKKELGVK